MAFSSASRASLFTVTAFCRSACCDTGAPFQRIEQSPTPLETIVTTAASALPRPCADPLPPPDGEQAAIGTRSRARLRMISHLHDAMRRQPRIIRPAAVGETARLVG